MAESVHVDRNSDQIPERWWRRRWDAEPRSVDYAIVTLVSSLLFLAIHGYLLQGHASDCYRAATSPEPAAAIRALDDRRCTQQPFDQVAKALGAELGQPVEQAQGHTFAASAWLVVWSAMLAVTCAVSVAAALAAGVALHRSWPELGPHLTRNSGWILLAGLVGAGSFNAAITLTMENISFYEGLHGRIVTLVQAVAGLAGVVSVTTIIAVGHAMAHAHPPDLAQIREATRVTNLLISALALAVTTAVLATTAHWRMIEALPGGEPVPSAVVVLFGAGLTAVVAALYLPTQARIHATTDRWIELMIANPDAYCPQAVARRKELRDDLAHRHSALAGYGTMLSVIAPVAGAAASSVLT